MVLPVSTLVLMVLPVSTLVLMVLPVSTLVLSINIMHVGYASMAPINVYDYYNNYIYLFNLL